MDGTVPAVGTDGVAIQTYVVREFVVEAAGITGVRNDQINRGDSALSPKRANPERIEQMGIAYTDLKGDG